MDLMAPRGPRPRTRRRLRRCPDSRLAHEQIQVVDDRGRAQVTFARRQFPPALHPLATFRGG